MRRRSAAEAPGQHPRGHTVALGFSQGPLPGHCGAQHCGGAGARRTSPGEPGGGGGQLTMPGDVKGARKVPGRVEGAHGSPGEAWAGQGLGARSRCRAPSWLAFFPMETTSCLPESGRRSCRGRASSRPQLCSVGARPTLLALSHTVRSLAPGTRHWLECPGGLRGHASRVLLCWEDSRTQRGPAWRQTQGLNVWPRAGPGSEPRAPGRPLMSAVDH